MSQEDKHNDDSVSSYEVSDFKACCSDLGLSDMNYTSCHYTRSNRTIWTKICRMLANPLWCNLQLTSHVYFHPSGTFSIYSEAHFQIGTSRSPSRHPFKFFNMWVDHHEYAVLISEGWQSPVAGTPMFVLCRKLKSLNSPLNNLNKGGLTLLNRVNQLKLNLFNLKSAEKAFFAQKLKCNFLKPSDRGTSFFHALMSHKHRKSFISAIQHSNEALTTYIDEVGVKYVHFYQNLLGTSSSTSTLDEVVVHCGPCLDETHSDFFLALVSNEAIKETLFSIGNDKAPGPDGYSSLFFKKSWDIVEADFGEAVQDFFSFRKILKKINHSIIALVLKSTNVNSANDFQPISCCNMVYKVISKILAVRLSRALSQTSTIT